MYKNSPVLVIAFSNGCRLSWPNFLWVVIQPVIIDFETAGLACGRFCKVSGWINQEEKKTSRLQHCIWLATSSSQGQLRHQLTVVNKIQWETNVIDLFGSSCQRLQLDEIDEVHVPDSVGSFAICLVRIKTFPELLYAWTPAHVAAIHICFTSTFIQSFQYIQYLDGSDEFLG